MTQDLELRHCRAFVAAVDHGGPTRAAVALGVAQSTVSEGLLALERAVGAPLFVRGRRAGGGSPALTRAGEALLPRARALLASAGEAVTAARLAAQGAEATLQLGAPESVTTYLLPPIVSDLAERWPHTVLQVTVGLCDDLRRAVATRALDLALIIEADDEAHATVGRHPAGTTTRVLAPARMVLVTAPGSPARRTPWSRSDLAAATLLTSDPSGTFRAALERYFAEVAEAPRVRSAGSVDAVKRGLDRRSGRSAAASAAVDRTATATESLQIGVLLAHAVEHELQQGELTEVVPASPLPAVFLKAVTRTGDELGPVGTALVAAFEGADLRCVR